MCKEEEKLCFCVPKEENGLRLDSFLANHIKTLSRTKIQKNILEGFCSIDDTVCRQKDCAVQTDQTITLARHQEREELTPEEGDLTLLYSDKDLCVINKSADLTVHPCPSCTENTLIQRLVRIFPDIQRMGGLRPGIVHRLDKDTSGLLLVARTEQARCILAEAFANRVVHKEYVALVSGVPPKEGICCEPIGRDPIKKTMMCILPLKQGGKEAKTAWKRLWVSKDKKVSLLALTIATGRTHQIRVHMRFLGYPLLGDKTYAPQSVAAKAPRQMLHARSLCFPHPITQKTCSFFSSPPSDFYETFMQCAHEPLRIVITGNPGSGKSTVTQYFKDKGFPTFSADHEVSKLYQKGEIVADYLACQGKESLLEAGAINKTQLYQALCKDPVFKREFENFVHACVWENLNAFWQKPTSRLFAEIPLWFECKKHDEKSNNCITVCVHCPKEIRFERLTKTRNWPYEKIAAIESWQWDESAKEKASTYVLDNSGTKSMLSKALVDLETFLTQYEKKIHAQDREDYIQCMEKNEQLLS